MQSEADSTSNDADTQPAEGPDLQEEDNQAAVDRVSSGHLVQLSSLLDLGDNSFQAPLQSPLPSTLCRNMLTVGMHGLTDISPV